jgi:hypothetical protein
MILGIPKDIEKYICVKSVDAEKLHKIGYIPVYREINKDRIYFLKTKEICETIDAINCSIVL